MRLKSFILFLIFLLTIQLNGIAQYPYYSIYNNDNGLPSNEVYSIIQDNKGFIWIGCDAGLFKFDGIRYIPYKCTSQRSKSITGLTLSSSGKLYCNNFQSQIFYIENDSSSGHLVPVMKELEHHLSKQTVIDIGSDTKGNIYVSHELGISQYSEFSKTWKNYTVIQFQKKHNSFSRLTKIAKGSLQDTVYFNYYDGLAKIENNKFVPVNNNDFFWNNPALRFELTKHQNSIWTFAKETSSIYCFTDNIGKEIKGSELNRVLQGRKITAVRSLSDGLLWICTYKGIVNYDIKKDSATLLYPDLAFSDIILDKAQNYWMSTLQEGIIRIPNLANKVWSNYKGITHLDNDGKHIFFATLYGLIGKLNINKSSIETYYTGYKADIQSLNFDTTSKALWFNINGLMYELKNKKLSVIKNNTQAIKSFYQNDTISILASSQGLFINNNKIYYQWCREFEYEQSKKTLWVATNNGLAIFKYKDNEWSIQNLFFPEIQILSIDFSEDKKILYALTFDGNIYSISTEYKINKIAKLPDNIQASKLKNHLNNIYLATNKGLVTIPLNEGNTAIPIVNLNKNSGLASDIITDVNIFGNSIWLASNKGLQQLPLEITVKRPLAHVFLKKNINNFNLKHKDALVLNPETNIYYGNGQYEYAYRINQNKWVKLPSTVNEITIPNPPSGEVKIELKVIDDLGRDSENIINISGYVHPPFWQEWWFVLGIILSFGTIAFLFYNHRLNKQKKDLNRQNELNIARLTAIRSQMNPHFIFNSLNAIQNLILQKKTVESYDYVVTFSELVRNALNYSTKDFIPFQQEIEFLNTYLKLEQLRFENDLKYSILYDEIDDLDVPSLMIQPFVENALLHGLLHKKGLKELHIQFVFANDLLICTVEDNGIGREKSNKIRTRQGNNHESFALDAIQKRMDIFNEQFDKTFAGFSFEDANPSLEEPGTIARIKLPFKRHF
ncbi:MAG TPA: histidine kinase [Edaphocola sp.]|nr:histidine kinase [Edaphocola sp.]